MTDPKVVLLIFVSGKLCSRRQSVEALSLAFSKMFPKLMEFRKQNVVVRASDR